MLLTAEAGGWQRCTREKHWSTREKHWSTRDEGVERYLRYGGGGGGVPKRRRVSDSGVAYEGPESTPITGGNFKPLESVTTFSCGLRLAATTTKGFRGGWVCG